MWRAWEAEASLSPILGQESVRHALRQSLFGPLDDFVNRPSKRFRSRLVEAGFAVASHGVPPSESARRMLEACFDALEAFHAGSLIVDDIEDGSRYRRGEPTLHLKYGLAPALNAGNWLYFWPLEKFRQLGLPAAGELALYRLCHRALLRAHFGQAIDVGVAIDRVEQARVSEICLASLGLKSGALTALALLLGASVAGATEPVLEALEVFGHEFGIGLQMLDDLGNLSAQQGKQYEDFYLRRPSWVWAYAAETFTPEEYARLVHAVSVLPDESFIRPLLELSDLGTLARTRALERLDQASLTLRATLPNASADALEQLDGLRQALGGAYL